MPRELNPRQQDLVEPLIHLADFIGGAVPGDLRAALVKCFCQHSAQGCFVQLLSDIRDAFDDRQTRRISSMSLLKFLNSLKSRPWSTWHNSGPMTPVDLARILRPHGISPMNVRDYDSVVKGYAITDFRSLWGHHFRCGLTKKEVQDAITLRNATGLANKHEGCSV